LSTFPGSLEVTVAYAARGVEAIVAVSLPSGATIADAVARSGLIARLGLDPAAIRFALHGRRAPGNAPLAHGDRVEPTRPLVVDPKEVRRARAR
jgi:uncharacterized protein